jgi:hypothetical protein
MFIASARPEEFPEESPIGSDSAGAEVISG